MAELPIALLLRRLAGADLAYLLERTTGIAKIVIPNEFSDSELANLIADADIAIGTAISPQLLKAAKRLKVFMNLGTGIDHLDDKAIAQSGVRVCVSHSSAAYVAEHAYALLLSGVKKIAVHDRLMRSGVWYQPQPGQPDPVYQSSSLWGSTIGILGYGRIGASVARLAAPLARQILAHTLHPERHKDTPNVAFVGLDDLLRRSDAVVVCLPLTMRTVGLIDAAALAKMKSTAILVNVARASIIDMPALHAALKDRRLGGAAIDVWPDGMETATAFAEMDSTILSPHRAGTVLGLSPHMQGVADNLVAYAAREELPNSVSFAAGY